MALPREVPATTLLPDQEGLKEEALVAMARLGDNGAFSELYRRHAPMTERMIQRITKNQDDTDDVLQETFSRVHTHLKDFDGRSRFSTWVTRIGMNCALMLYRKKKRLSESSLDESVNGATPLEIRIPDRAISPEASSILSNQLAELAKAIERLPPNLRMVVNTRLRDDSTIQQMADITGLSLPAAKSRWMRGTHFLKQSMKAQSGYVSHCASGLKLAPGDRYASPREP